MKRLIAYFIATIVVIFAGGYYYLGLDVSLPNFGIDFSRRVILVHGFDANSRYFALSVAIKNKTSTIVIYDTQTKIFSTIVAMPTSKLRGVSHPKFSSQDPNILYVTQYETANYVNVKSLNDFSAERQLLKCDLTTAKCSEVFSGQLWITNPVEIGDSALLFVGSKPSIWADGFAPDTPIIKYAEKDFYVYEADGKITRLTKYQFYDLNSVSLFNDKLVFAGRLSGRSPIYDKYEQPGYDPSGSSDIWSMNFDKASRAIDIESEEYKPFVKTGNSLDSAPSVRSGITAILSREKSNYDIWVLDSNKKKIGSVKARKNQSFYKPIVISRSKVRYGENIGGKLELFEYDIIQKTSRKLVSKSITKILTDKKSSRITTVDN